ncbi:MAG: argininosuccinate lyase [Candidatus Roizmanbacteria bacterium]
MAQKLWQKKQYKLHDLVEKFETGSDILLDQNLVKADVYGSLAHAVMLTSINILTDAELKKLILAGKEILALNDEGKFKLQFGDEDIHTKVENYITTHYGDVGKKLHAGRSRNDQVLVDIRFFTKESLIIIYEKYIALIETLHVFALKYEYIPMPGYTHMQRAMPSSIGMWAGAYAESMTDTEKIFATVYDLNNQSPLGSGAGYGVILPLDRQMVSDLLGFAKVQNNSLYTQNSRGKIESAILFLFLQMLFDISKLASDVLLFTTTEFNFFHVSDELCTGSSIMPQKKNVDVAELLRSKVHIMQGYFHQVFNTVLNLPSGYNRDFQDTKKPFMEAIQLMPLILDVTKLLIENIAPNKESLTRALGSEIYATGASYDLVQKGIPFREAYKQIGENLDHLKKVDSDEVLRQSQHIGGTGNLNLSQITDQIINLKKKISKERSSFENTLEKLINIS